MYNTRGGMWSAGKQADSHSRFGPGVLHVEICEARKIKGDELFGCGKADPYLVVKHGSGRNGVVLRSRTHQDGGANPVWNCLFSISLRNGGIREHNNLDIEIWNENRHTRHLGRKDNQLGHISFRGELAGFITQHRHNITGPIWFPVFYTPPGQDKKPKGEILIKFYFQSVEEGVFAHGYHTHAEAQMLEDSKVHRYTAEAMKFDVDFGNVSDGFGAVFGGISAVFAGLVLL